ncbi:MAG: DUF448 domain-containing protein [Magnetococcales bacterium]|nr:DUF448 domain-containing protein [Magnetococcales bacterium]
MTLHRADQTGAGQERGQKRAVGDQEHNEAHDSPLRRCAITRNRRPKALLLRFVADPQGRLVEDVSERLPGRGIHVLPDQKRVTALLTRHKMARNEIEVILTRLGTTLEKRLLDGVGLARRTGGCRKGLREVEELLKRGQKPLLLLAEDASGLRARIESLLPEDGAVEIVIVPAQERLGTLWSGRPVSLVAVTHLGIGERIRADAARWWSFTREAEGGREGSGGCVNPNK